MENKDQVQIKPVNPEDYQIIANIYNEHISSGIATMDETLKTATDVADWIKKFNARERLYTLIKGSAKHLRFKSLVAAIVFHTYRVKADASAARKLISEEPGSACDVSIHIYFKLLGS